MDNNILNTFILREDRVEVNKTSKIHVEYPSIEDHAIYMKGAELGIPLQLWDILSLFHVCI